MRKALILARREYKASVKTKGFIIGLIIAPVFMSGSAIAMALLKDRVDTRDRVVAVVDHSGVVAEGLAAAAEQRNAEVAFDKETGERVKPSYVIEAVQPDTADLDGQRLALSDRVRAGEIHAFLEVSPDVLHPAREGADARMAYYGKNAAMDDVRGWLPYPINGNLRRERMAETGVEEATANEVLWWINVEAMGLVSADAATGEIQQARRSSEGEALGIPLAMVMLMFLMIMMGAMPLLSAVMEEKTQRIAEVLLGSIKPFPFMLGKVLGGVGVSLTSATVYVIVGVIAMRRLEWEEYIPYHILPWFFAYMILAIFMLGSVLSALGSACNDAKDAQNVTFPAMLPMMIPMFLLMPVLKEPQSGLATWLSFFPPFTPTLMLLRQSTPGGVPAWQPWGGLAGLLAVTLLSVWAAGRIFRVGILMQGTPPRLGNFVRWAIRG
jgi:ABC-2 type transport system permease protein